MKEAYLQRTKEFEDKASLSDKDKRACCSELEQELRRI